MKYCYLIPAGRDASPLQCYPSAGMWPVPIFIHLDEEKQSGAKVPCLRKQRDRRG